MTAGRSPHSRRAASLMAWPTGCSEACSSAPASLSSSLRSLAATGITARSCMRPVVTVPVLSSTIVSTRRVDSSTSGPLIRMPSCAPRPVPTSNAVGVARPSAHGQAMIRTATAAVNASPAPAPASSQNASVAAERASTIGTKIAEMRSARRWMGALPACASLTRRPICASAVSPPIFVARTTMRPPALIAAPTTASPGRFSTGVDSPVSSA